MTAKMQIIFNFAKKKINYWRIGESVNRLIDGDSEKVCARRVQSQTCLNYAEAQPNFMRAKPE